MKALLYDEMAKLSVVLVLVAQSSTLCRLHEVEVACHAPVCHGLCIMGHSDFIRLIISHYIELFEIADSEMAQLAKSGTPKVTYFAERVVFLLIFTAQSVCTALVALFVSLLRSL